MFNNDNKFNELPWLKKKSSFEDLNSSSILTGLKQDSFEAKPLNSFGNNNSFEAPAIIPKPPEFIKLNSPLIPEFKPLQPLEQQQFRHPIGGPLVGDVISVDNKPIGRLGNFGGINNPCNPHQNFIVGHDGKTVFDANHGTVVGTMNSNGNINNQMGERT